MTDNNMAIQQNTSPQNWALLIIYSGYRSLLALVLLAMFLLTADKPILGRTNLEVFVLSGAFYAAFALSVLVYQLLRSTVANATQIFTGFFVDILALTAISHSSGGVETGLDLLLVITVAAANMLLRARLGVLVASLASLAVLGDTAYLVLSGVESSQQFLPAGLLGMAYFATAIMIQYLTQRILTAQQLAESRRADVQQLLEINQRIVQKMRTGIVVVRNDGIIRLMNEAAAELLNIPYAPAGLPQVAPRSLVELCSRHTTGSFREKFRESGPEVQVNVTTLGPDVQDERLVFLEDMAKLSQHAQQLKLASLGRFTASIAHEIRNPLGAISHAAQLLAESEHLAESDRRLTEIIDDHSDRMNKVVENILQLSRRKNAEPTQLDLHEWLLQTICKHNPDRDSHKHIELESDGRQHTVNADPSQLLQIVTNIVDNGLYYSEKATGTARVVIRLRHSAVSSAPMMDIVDFGEGVPPDRREQIFEPFFTTRPSGNGLGLYICRELSEANQIHLSYLVTSKGESCFRLQFSHPDRAPLTQ